MTVDRRKYCQCSFCILSPAGTFICELDGGSAIETCDHIKHSENIRTLDWYQLKRLNIGEQKIIKRKLTVNEVAKQKQERLL